MSVPQNETILETIERRLIPDEQAKKARGEVFTPLNLVREMLYGLRKSELESGTQTIWGVDASGNVVDDSAENRIGGVPLEIWRDPETKWLDPANGIGNFPFVAFYMLDFQLKNHGSKGSKEWSDEKRQRHIVENMLYMIELDRGNVNTSFKVMSFLVPGSKPHICCANTLKLTDDNLKTHFGLNRFDVVMGNPPFQAPITVRTGSAGHETIWDTFITKSFEWLKNTGFLLFITPPPWRKPENKLWNLMSRDNQLLYLRILGEKETSKMFTVAARVDMYIIQKIPSNTSTHIIDELHHYHLMDIRDWHFLPNYMYVDIDKIMTKTGKGIDILFNSFYDSRKPYISKTKQGDFIHPIVHGITGNGLSLLYTSDKSKGHFGKSKVLLNMNRNQYPVNDFKGEYGMSQYTFGIPITTKEEGDQIVTAINSDRFKEIIKATKWGAFQTEYKMFKYFKPDFYKEFLKKPEGGIRMRTRRNNK